MSVIDFGKMPDTSRVWIFAAQRPLDSGEVNLLEENMAAFLQDWTAHRRNLTAAWQLFCGQFIVVAVDENRTGASGCSIDTLVRNLRHLETSLDCLIVGTAASVFYRDATDEIRCVDRPAFKRLVTEGKVTAETTVFNTTVETIGDVRGGKWELPMRDSWHWAAFTPASA